MDIETHLSDDNKTLTIKLVGRFDYTCHQSFLSAYESIEPAPEKYIIDTLGLSLIDSSALGNLLLLRKHAGEDDANIRITNTNDDIYKLICNCRFDDLFTVERQ